MSVPLKASADCGLGHAVPDAAGCAGYRLGLTACILRQSDALSDGSLGWRSLQRQLTPRWDGGAAC